MKRITRSGVAFLLGASLLAGALGTDTAAAASREKSWYEDLQVKDPYVTVSVSEDGYLYTDDGKSTPTVSQSSSKVLKGASSLPSAYMNTLAELIEKYPSIRNQGDYNTCWAFSAIGLAEFDLIADNQTADNTVDLSEYQLSYFTYHNQADAFGGTTGDAVTPLEDYLQFGGNLDYTTRTLLQWQGVTDESLMPYTTSLSSTKSYDSSYAFDQDVAHLQNAYIINIHTNQDAVKREIMNHGSAGIGLYWDTSNAYNSEAVYDKTGELVSTYYFPYSSGFGIFHNTYVANHALNIVGWDDDFPASAFAKTPEGNGAWLVRNSWSDKTENGADSYFWLSYYDKSLEDEAWIYDFESADNYDYIYQYDGCGDVYGINGLLGTYSKNGFKSLNIKNYANVFQVQGASNELLQAVSIALNEDTNVSYTISIYTNLASPSKPKSGILAATVSGQTSYAGTYTIPLSKAVSLPKGTYYSVVVELGKAGTGIDTEFSYDYRRAGANLISTANIDANQSFIYYENAWHDLADIDDSQGIGNLCIKAYTDKTGTSVAQAKSLKSSAIKKTSVKLSWTKASGATGYEIYRASSKTGTYTKVATTKKNSYTNTKLKANTTYYYKVRAYKTSGSTTVYGKLSGAVKVTTKKK